MFFVIIEGRRKMNKLSKKVERIVEIIGESIIGASLILTVLQLGGNIDLPVLLVAWPLIIIGVGFIVVSMICIGGIAYEIRKEKRI